MHFQWINREKNEIVDDLIVVEDAYLERIDKCTTGRVYLLRFTSSDKKQFFWMQEPSNAMDAELIKTFNDAIGAKIPEKGAKPAGGAAAAPGVNPELAAVLQQFLASQGQGGAGGAPRQAPVPLGSALTTEVCQSLLTDDAAVTELQSLLPEGQQSREDLNEALSSPQLQQAFNSLTQAVHSDQLPILFSSLGLDPNVAAQMAPGSDALEALCRAMEAKFGEGDAPQ